MSDIELWKKILHPNLVHLREVFTTKAFGDNCMYHQDIVRYIVMLTF